MSMQEKIELFEKVKQWAVVLMWSLLGICAKIASINKGQKITKRQAIATIFTGIFCGFICSTICQHYKIDTHLTAAFISVSALSGENITAWILGNSKDILNKILSILIKQKK